MTDSSPSWSVFDTFRFVRPDSWRQIVAWEATVRADLAIALRDLDATVAQWDKHLEPFGGEPSRQDWSQFRPLRVEHEEDWSNWLAWLIATSRTGGFARRFFGEELAPTATDYVAPFVDREVPTPGRIYRADIVVDWRTGGRTAVEVKVGDKHLSKTDATADAAAATHSALLLPVADLPLWLDTASDESRTIVRTWESVAIALRAALWSDDEDPRWRCWATAFTGNIEQKLLGFPHFSSGAMESLLVAHLRREQLRLMTEAIIRD